MAVVGQDLFTGTAGTLITARSPDLGAWAPHGSNAATMVITDANRCRLNTSGPSQLAVYYMADPGVDSYEVEADLTRLSALAEIVGVAARIDTAANTRYFVAQDNSASVIRVGKVVAGVVTSLGTPFANTSNRNVRLRVGSNSQRWWVDDVEQTDPADGSITARGRPGVHGVGAGGAPSGNAVGVHIDNWTVDDLTVGGAGISVTPDTEALTLTGNAPTVSATANVAVTPATEALTVTGFAPTVTASDHQIVAPATEALQVSGFAPAVAASSHQNVTPATEQLRVTGLAPTVTASNHITVTPALEQLTIVGHAPGVFAGTTALPAAASLTLTGHSPTVTVTAHVTAQPAPASVVLSGQAPTVSATGHVVAAPAMEALVVRGYAPAVSVFDASAPPSFIATPGARLLSTIPGSRDLTATPGARSLTATPARRQ